MAGVIVVFPKSDDAKSIRNLLVRNGYDVAAVCTSGAQALSAADRIGSGVVVCGYKYPDMLYEELYENVMPSFAPCAWRRCRGRSSQRGNAASGAGTVKYP